MVNRVTTKLNDGTHGLFISKPGIDVLTASQWEMVFDSRNNYAATVIQTGTASRGATVSFPTQSYTPQAIVSIVTAGNMNGLKYYNSAVEDIYLYGEDTGYNFVRKRLIEPIYKITSNSIEFIDDYVANYDPSGGYTVRYAILRIPGAV